VCAVCLFGVFFFFFGGGGGGEGRFAHLGGLLITRVGVVFNCWVESSVNICNFVCD
jgi:hypothetical protein